MRHVVPVTCPWQPTLFVHSPLRSAITYLHTYIYSHIPSTSKSSTNHSSPNSSPFPSSTTSILSANLLLFHTMSSISHKSIRSFLFIALAIFLLPQLAESTVIRLPNLTESRLVRRGRRIISGRGGGCIAIHSLQHFPRNKLIFKDHIRRVAFCDRNGSCATPGHMVVYNGKSMMMSSYCEINECERKTLLVNSPTYESGLRVKSLTPGLEFTAFAAKYESKPEETVLRMAIGAGY